MSCLPYSQTQRPRSVQKPRAVSHIRYRAGGSGQGVCLARGSFGPPAPLWEASQNKEQMLRNNDLTAEWGPTHPLQKGKGQWMPAKSCSEPQREAGRQASTLTCRDEEQREENTHTLLPPPTPRPSIYEHFLIKPYNSTVCAVIDPIVKMRK